MGFKPVSRFWRLFDSLARERKACKLAKSTKQAPFCSKNRLFLAFMSSVRIVMSTILSKLKLGVNDIEMTNGNIALAIQDFRRARNRANLQEIVARLTGKSAHLLSYEDVRRKLKAKKSGVRTLKEIPLDSIVGSVGRYNDFTRSFLPRRNSDEGRWARVKVAINLKGLQPIKVYQIDQVYFVLDGNHRVSIARQHGASHIQAYVTKVHTKAPLSPDVQPDDLIVKAEYTDFLEHTRLDKFRPEADLSITVPGRYQALEEHIELHRYFLNQEQEQEISYEKAAAHWYDDVYLPVVRIIRNQGILWNFPGRTETDLYLWVSQHRAELEKELGWEIEPDAAADDLIAQFSSKPRRVVSRVSKKVIDAVTPDELESGPAPGQWRRKRLKRRQTDRMFTDVLVAIDGQEAGWRAVEYALFVAQHEEARLHALHVVPTEVEKESAEASSIRAEFTRRCESAGVSGKLAIETGKIARQICQRARWADLVVLSLSHPPGPQPIARLGSGLSTIMRRCPRPILVAPRVPSPRLNRALLAYDGSPKSEEALFVATYLSAQWNVPLVVVTVVEMGRTTSETLAHAKQYLEGHGGEATFMKKSGPVAEVILQMAEEQDCDLIVLGGYGFNPVLEVVLGSAVDEVLRTSRLPTLVCR